MVRKLCLWISGLFGALNAAASEKHINISDLARVASVNDQDLVDVSGISNKIYIPRYSFFDSDDFYEKNSCVSNVEVVDESKVYVDISGCDVLTIPGSNDFLMAGNWMEDDLKGKNEFL